MPRRLRLALASILLGTLGLVACPGDDSSGNDTETTTTGTDTPGNTTQATPADTTASPPATSEGSNSTGLPETTEDSSGEPPAEPGIHWVGRYDDSDPAARRMGWSGAGLVVRFDGTSVSVELDDAAQYFTVLVDGMLQPPLVTSPGEQTYPLATDLPPGEHTVELYRRTEGSFGATVVHGVDIDGELLPPPVVQRRMEIIGDSITAGYGNEGVDPCSFSALTENHYQTYGAITARSLGAELHTVAWSGKGVIYNFGDDVVEPLPEVYDRIVATEGAPWDFSWQPDVVVINLGTNDFSTGNDPPEPLFVNSYLAFMTHLRDVYPNAFILIVAPSLFGAEATMVEGYLLDVIAQRQAAGDAAVAYADINVEWIGVGCDGHPTVATHEGMGARLVQELQTHLGW